MRYFTICPERCEANGECTIINEQVGLQKETPTGGRYMTLFLNPSVTYTLMKDTDNTGGNVHAVYAIKEYIEEGVPKRKYYRAGRQVEEKDGTSLLTLAQHPEQRFRVFETTDRESGE